MSQNDAQLVVQSMEQLAQRRVDAGPDRFIDVQRKAHSDAPLDAVLGSSVCADG